MRELPVKRRGDHQIAKGPCLRVVGCWIGGEKSDYRKNCQVSKDEKKKPPRSKKESHFEKKTGLTVRAAGEGTEG